MRPSPRSGAVEHTARIGPGSHAATNERRSRGTAYARRPPRNRIRSPTRACVFAQHHRRQRERSGPGEQARRAGPEHAPGERHREQRADEELERSGVGAVVRAIDAVGGRRPSRRRTRPRRSPPTPRTVATRRPRSSTSSPTISGRQHEIELLLDGERPEVLQRRRRREEIRVRLPGREEAPVGDVGERGERRRAGSCARSARRAARRATAAASEHAGDGGGEEPADPAGVEAAERDAPDACATRAGAAR